ncbi:hypothetical protein ABFS82_01G049400 [Erythranthe guttata]|uniref:Glycosyltransferase n=1 Tax=Erythranthe guttata TaxID=4155 RepID=A0A022RAZ3_ERYGU|nr:PREDICTED: uncharacterized protein At4g15970-like [Erythranthe guttata]EYU37477.1 hypothetical protein MIMGU_mgv1a007746mg [Erythranthe guttata]|eukprot:XP_012837376.1 PREDICTED: uncharacterized protein At4g15970-like [Erythranthe guttata]
MDSAARGGGAGGSNSKDGEDILESGGYRQDNHHDSSIHHQYFSSTAVKSTLIFMVVGVTCLVLINQSGYPTQLFRSYSFSGPKEFNNNTSGNISSPSCDNRAAVVNVSSPANEENELEKTLKSAAMKDNKTVIITTLNAAWTEPNSIFDLFLESFKIGNGTQDLLKHVLVVALDQKAYSRCLEVQLHCYALTTEGIDFSGEAHFMSEDYLKMMWRRIDFLHTVLQLGYDFVFTDADVMWLRNPFERFHPDGDFQIACDHYWFNYTDVNNSPNGGFNYVKSNNRTIQFYKFWHTGREYFPGKHDQDVLNAIKMNPFIKRIGLEMRFLDTAEFGGFCEPSKDLDRVVTMHANCCIGMENKIHDIKMVIDDWKRYNISIPIGGERNVSTRFWTVPRFCG